MHYMCVCVCVCVCAFFFGWLVSTFDWFYFFCSIEFTMDLHPYDIERHDTTRHDIGIMMILWHVNAWHCVKTCSVPQKMIHFILHPPMF